MMISKSFLENDKNETKFFKQIETTQL